jgi:hypothetical protein
MEEQDKLRIGTWWVLANVVGVLAGHLVGSLVCGILWRCPPAPPHGSIDCFIQDPISWMMVIGLAVGTFVGMAEWFILRKYASRTRWWVAASILGWAIGLGIQEALNSLLRQPIRNLNIEMMSGAIAGFIVGLTQWVVLRKIVYKAGWWILAMMLSGFLTFWFNVPSAIFVGSPGLVCVGGLTGVITAITLVRLLKHPLSQTTARLRKKEKGTITQ